MSNEIIKPGSVISLKGPCGLDEDYLLAQIKPNKFKLIQVRDGNRLRDEVIKPSNDSTFGITHADLAAYLGPNHKFEVRYQDKGVVFDNVTFGGMTTKLRDNDHVHAIKADLGDRGPEVTKPELERLACLAEEAGEIVQIVNKIIRHGYESFNPNDPKQTSNRILLEREIGDLIAIMEMMCDAKDLDFDNIEENINSKMERVKKYLHHQ